jgi:hypothetical protein
MDSAGWRRTAAAALSVVAAAATAIGCGAGSSYKNEPRPPAPIVVTASISNDRVSVSPRIFGAGPISLVVTNQTGASQQVTLESIERIGQGPGIRQQTAPINPLDTATLKATIDPGRYRVGVGGGITPGILRVGRERPSAQNDLLQP